MTVLKRDAIEQLYAREVTQSTFARLEHLGEHERRDLGVEENRALEDEAGFRRIRRDTFPRAVQFGKPHECLDISARARLLQPMRRRAASALRNSVERPRSDRSVVVRRGSDARGGERTQPIATGRPMGL